MASQSYPALSNWTNDADVLRQEMYMKKYKRILYFNCYIIYLQTRCIKETNAFAIATNGALSIW